MLLRAVRRTGHAARPCKRVASTVAALSSEQFHDGMLQCGIQHDLEQSGRLVLAVGVSGGPDSLALTCLAADWASGLGANLRRSLGHSEPPTVLAITVDHALRPESAREAASVATLLSARGIAHVQARIDWRAHAPSLAHDGGHTLDRGWSPNLSKKQSMARDARRALLAAVCHHAGAHVLLLAHTADDNEETLLHRLARASGVLGLHGMRPRDATLHGITVARPLLSVRKAALYATCAAYGVVPIEDPSNANADFDRVRIRHALRAMRAVTCDPPQPTPTANPSARSVDFTSVLQHQRDLHDSVVKDALHIFRACVRVDVASGVGVVNVDALAARLSASHAFLPVQFCLSKIVSGIGGRAVAPPSAALAQLRAFIQQAPSQPRASDAEVAHVRVHVLGRAAVRWCLKQPSLQDVTFQWKARSLAPVPALRLLPLDWPVDACYVVISRGSLQLHELMVLHARGEDDGRVLPSMPPRAAPVPVANLWRRAHPVVPHEFSLWDRRFLLRVRGRPTFAYYVLRLTAHEWRLLLLRTPDLHDALQRYVPPYARAGIPVLLRCAREEAERMHLRPAPSSMASAFVITPASHADGSVVSVSADHVFERARWSKYVVRATDARWWAPRRQHDNRDASAEGDSAAWLVSHVAAVPHAFMRVDDDAGMDVRFSGLDSVADMLACSSEQVQLS